MRRLATLAAILAFSTSAHAQTIDQAGADQLQRNLETYVSKAAFEKGVLKITPETDRFRLAIDVKPLLTLVPEFKDIKLDAAPFTMTLKPRADGKIDVESAEFPAVTASMNGQPPVQVFSMGISGYKHSSVFDPAIAASVSGQDSATGLMWSTDILGSKSSSKYSQIDSTWTGAAAADGGIDFAMQQSLRDYEETTEMPLGEMGAPIPYTVKSPLANATTDIKGLRTKAILDLVAFGVANPQDTLVKAKQDQLKGLLLAALPLWNHFNTAQVFENFNVASPVGTLTFGKMDVTVALDGIREDGQAAIGVKLEDVKAASLFMPNWAPQFVPTYIDLRLRGDNIDLDATARKAIAAMDLNQDPPVPEALSNEIAAAYMASPPRMLIDKSTFRNSLSEFTTEGEFTFPGGKPRFVSVLEAKDFDKTIEAMKTAAAEMPDFNEGVLVAQMAKGMATTLPDGRLQWNLRAEADGSVFVNDQMVKGPDPIEPDPTELAPDATAPSDDAAPEELEAPQDAAPEEVAPQEAPKAPN